MEQVPVNQTQATVARLLDGLATGDRDALDELFELVYGELKQLARRQRRRWHGNDTLDTTALVHEAYVKLVGQARIGVGSHAHFRALAARAMRHILCDYARDRGAQKRGGGLDRLPLQEFDGALDAAASSQVRWGVLVELDHALRGLAEVDARAAQVVECRFFGGLSVEETATAMDISPRTVKRDWALAQAWLHRELTTGA
jgi:RNA polymerase sigma factor (TIGR02999 family)